MRFWIHRISPWLAGLCLIMIPIDCAFGINAWVTSSWKRYVPYILLAWVFAIAGHLSRPRPLSGALSIWNVRALIHRASRLLVIVSFSMLPIGLIIEANEWGQMAESFMSASLLYTFLFYVVYDKTRPIPSSASAPTKGETPVPDSPE